MARSLSNLTEIALRSGAREEAHGNLKEVLPIVRDLGFEISWQSRFSDGRQSWLRRWAMRRGRRVGLAQLRRSRARWVPIATSRGRANHATIMARVREKLGAPEFERATAEGAALDYEEALCGGTGLAGGSGAVGTRI